MSKMTLNFSPLTGRVFLGRVNPKTGVSIGEQRDVTSEFLQIMEMKFPVNTTQLISVNGENKYRVIVVDLDKSVVIDGKVVQEGSNPGIVAESQRNMEPVGWYTEDHLNDKSATTYNAEVAQRWRDKGWPVWPLYTTPQPTEQRETVASAPVAAQQRFRHPQKSTQGWSIWQSAAISLDRPSWEIDSQGFEVEYRLLYEAPQPEEQQAEPDAALVDALESLIRGYVRLLEAGMERITSLGGDCDPVSVMEQNDPWLRVARKALATHRKQEVSNGTV